MREEKRIYVWNRNERKRENIMVRERVHAMEVITQVARDAREKERDSYGRRTHTKGIIKI